MKKLTICADDYGLSPAISLAIRELISKGSLNATSVMVTAPELNDANAVDVVLLKTQKEFNPNLQIGLHLTLTRCLPSLTLNREFMSLPATMLNSFLGGIFINYRLEIIAQYQKFVDIFGFHPDYIDGHQHVHLLPTVRPVLYKLLQNKAWIRQCGGAGVGVKAKIISALSQKLIAETKAFGINTNVGFSGSYHFDSMFDFRPLFLQFLQDLPDNSLIMVHPGHIDELLKQRDPVWESREIEYEYLAGKQFHEDVAHAGFDL